MWSLLCDNGSIDWAGLPLVVGLMGIDDIDGLLVRLKAIKKHVRKDS